MENILNKITYGMYVVSSGNSTKKAGCVINTLTQITSEDPIISISLNKNNYTNKIIKETKKFAISILSIDTSMNLINTFGFNTSEKIDKFKDYNYITEDNIQILTSNTCGYLLCETKEIIDCNTHSIILGKVLKMKKISDLEPMTYSYYRNIKKGTTPPSAPSFQKEKPNINSNYKKYQCIICGEIYDEEVEQVKFENLNDDWVCPKCQVPKKYFKLVE